MDDSSVITMDERESWCQESQNWLLDLWRDALHADDVDQLRKVVMDLIAWIRFNVRVES